MSNFWKMYEEVKANEKASTPQIVTSKTIKPKDPEEPQTVSDIAEQEDTTATEQVETESEELDGITSDTDL